MKRHDLSVKLKFAFSLDAENEQEARDIVKDTFLADYNIKLEDKEITNDDQETNLILELRDALREHGIEEDDLKQIFEYYNKTELFDYVVEEWEHDSEL